MNRALTLFARGVVYLVGVAALAICFILLPELIREESVGKSVNIFQTYSLLGGVYLLVVPFFIALFQTHRLLHFIEKNNAFTPRSINALQKIKICVLSFTILLSMYVITGVSISHTIDPHEDVTPFVTIGSILTFVTIVIGVFVAVLQKLVVDAIALKSENDLIV